MMTAEPVVKPLITLWDRKLERKPSLRVPAVRYMRPAMSDTCRNQADLSACDETHIFCQRL